MCILLSEIDIQKVVIVTVLLKKENEVTVRLLMIFYTTALYNGMCTRKCMRCVKVLVSYVAGLATVVKQSLGMFNFAQYIHELLNIHVTLSHTQIKGKWHCINVISHWLWNVNEVYTLLSVYIINLSVEICTDISAYISLRHSINPSNCLMAR